jgi:hypothetical protein
MAGGKEECPSKQQCDGEENEGQELRPSSPEGTHGCSCRVGAGSVIVLRMAVIVVSGTDCERSVLVSPGADDDRQPALVERRHISGRAGQPKRQQQRK